ncbi:unnamed protein product [Callosobruchus maculatus]|uniref:BRISC and BRCA1-A complex member 2 n=1 Tax=Callosobruchus maculatus TaxID=64391 RepID=A0A653CPW7_CALMS|nr:unnamed protein product [Callosobruchus maculatus]
MGISPCLKKHFDELCLNSCLGLSSISYNDITPYNSADFIIKVPYAGKKLKWDILFDPDDFTFPPDFDFNDDCFLADPDLEILEQNAPSLENWNLDNPKMLAIILNEFLEYYKKLQIEKLKIENIYSRYYEEYEDLISGDHIKPEDVQVSVDSSNMIIFLIEIKLDLTALIEYCNDLELLDLDSNIQLKITINKMDGSNTKSYIQYPPQMEHLFGDHPALPKFGKEVPIKEYVAAVNEMLTQKISHITEGCRLRKEFIRSIYALCRSYTVEVDTKHFTRIIILAKHQEYSCLVTIIAGNKFPQEKPIIKLSSIYCQEGKSCNKILPKYQYNTALGPDKNAYNLVKSLPQLICQMKQHKC